MYSLMDYWSISSEVIVDEAKKLGLWVEIIVPEKNLFRIFSHTQSILFKSTDCGLNTALGMKIADDK